MCRHGRPLSLDQSPIRADTTEEVAAHWTGVSGRGLGPWPEPRREIDRLDAADRWSAGGVGYGACRVRAVDHTRGGRTGIVYRPTWRDCPYQTTRQTALIAERIVTSRDPGPTQAHLLFVRRRPVAAAVLVV
jgi:hypothetical protein